MSIWWFQSSNQRGAAISKVPFKGYYGPSRTSRSFDGNAQVGRPELFARGSLRVGHLIMSLSIIVVAKRVGSTVLGVPVLPEESPGE